MASSSRLFGPVARASIGSEQPAEIPNEVELMGLLRIKVGPHASEDKLRVHLRVARGRLHWAVNSYFREVCSRKEWMDYSPKRLKPDGQDSAPQGQMTAVACANCPEDQAGGVEPEEIGLSSLPVALLERILIHCGPLTVCSASRASKGFALAGTADQVWRRLYLQRWGVPPANSVLASNVWESEPTQGASIEPGAAPRMQMLFKNRMRFERDMRCLKCGGQKVVPLVFGFPSPALRQCMGRGMLVLGGDYLADGEDPIAAACWICLACQIRYTRYPHGVATARYSAQTLTASHQSHPG